LLGAVVVALGACGTDTKPATPNGNAGGNGSAAGSAGEAGASSDISNTAQWPMPNSPGLGLPNPANYDAETTPGVVHDLVTGLDWLKAPGTELYSQADAVIRCSELSFADFDDWRLPAFIELVSLFDVVPNEADPLHPIYISTAFDAEGRFWSATPVSDAGLGRLLDFSADDCGTSAVCSIGVAGRAVDALGGAFCVRGQKPPLAAARYEVSDDTVRDLYTGLSWQAVPAAVQTVDYADALSACEALGDGARLPSITELLSILVPLLDKKAFPNWPSDAFAWSSSSIPAKPGTHWAGAIGGATKAEPPSNRNRVECVR
jgi:hypothetical protein